jgi:hypothetical protein
MVQMLTPKVWNWVGLVARDEVAQWVIGSLDAVTCLCQILSLASRQLRRNTALSTFHTFLETQA